LIVAIQDRSIHDIATKVGAYNKTGGAPPAPNSSRH